MAFFIAVIKGDGPSWKYLRIKNIFIYRFVASRVLTLAKARYYRQRLLKIHFSRCVRALRLSVYFIFHNTILGTFPVSFHHRLLFGYPRQVSDAKRSFDAAHNQVDGSVCSGRRKHAEGWSLRGQSSFGRWGSYLKFIWSLLFGCYWCAWG